MKEVLEAAIGIEPMNQYCWRIQKEGEVKEILLNLSPDFRGITGWQ